MKIKRDSVTNQIRILKVGESVSFSIKSRSSIRSITYSMAPEWGKKFKSKTIGQTIRVTRLA